MEVFKHADSGHNSRGSVKLLLGLKNQRLSYTLGIELRHAISIKTWSLFKLNVGKLKRIIDFN